MILKICNLYCLLKNNGLKLVVGTLKSFNSLKLASDCFSSELSILILFLFNLRTNFKF